MTTKQAQLNTDDVQTLDNAFQRHGLPPLTRRALLATAAGAAVAAGVPGIASAANADSAMEIGTAAVTAEALAVTYLSNLIEKGGHAFPKPVQNVLKAANHAEQDHYQALHGLGFKPLTTKFWIPNAALGPGNVNLFATLEVAETLFINAYLIAITAFAKLKKDSLARYAGEILGVEAEHRALARYANNVVHGQTTLTRTNVPNNKAFETYTIKSIGGIVAALEKAGFGFGKQGATPGSFYDFDGTKFGNFSSILADFPA